MWLEFEHFVQHCQLVLPPWILYLFSVANKKDERMSTKVSRLWQRWGCCVPVQLWRRSATGTSFVSRVLGHPPPPANLALMLFYISHQSPRPPQDSIAVSAFLNIGWVLQILRIRIRSQDPNFSDTEPRCLVFPSLDSIVVSLFGITHQHQREPKQEIQIIILILKRGPCLTQTSPNAYHCCPSRLGSAGEVCYLTPSKIPIEKCCGPWVIFKV